MGSCNAVMVFYIEGYIVFFFFFCCLFVLGCFMTTFYPVECGNIY